MEPNPNSTPQFGSGGGAPSASVSSGGCVSSTLSKAEEQDDLVVSSEVSSCPDESELDLGLGLSLGGGGGNGGGVRAFTTGRKENSGRILTAKDFTSSSSSSSSSSSLLSRVNNGFAGNKRTADSVSAANALNNQVVGWPPVRAYRMNSLSNQAKLSAVELNSIITKGTSKEAIIEKTYRTDIHNSKPNMKGNIRTSLFVKVNMDGIPIGRKVDLSAHAGYDTLAKSLEEMFHRPTRKADSTRAHDENLKAPRPLELRSGTSEFVLTYEDRDGDWMLVGDVPWGMFVHSAKRLRIMRRSEANGLAPIFQEQNERQRSRPV